MTGNLANPDPFATPTPKALPAEDVYQPPKIVRGRKQYHCCECGLWLLEGDEHELFSGKFRKDSPALGAEATKDEADHDGRVWRTWRTCMTCVAIRRRATELLPSDQKPLRGGLATACGQILQAPVDLEPGEVLQRFRDTYRID